MLLHEMGGFCMRKIKLVTLSTKLMAFYSKFLINGAGPLMKISLINCVCEEENFNKS